MRAANADATARTMSFFFKLEVVLIDFVPDFEFRIAHSAARMFGYETALLVARLRRAHVRAHVVVSILEKIRFHRRKFL